VIVAAWQDAALDAERIQWVRDYYQTTAPHSEVGRLRQLHGRRRPSQDPGQLPRNYSRLREIKRAYDPDNLFHRNQNIQPEE
jgi:FAD/FMN-containing dehydrogenase